MHGWYVFYNASRFWGDCHDDNCNKKNSSPMCSIKTTDQTDLVVETKVTCQRMKPNRRSNQSKMFGKHYGPDVFFALSNHFNEMGRTAVCGH